MKRRRSVAPSASCLRMKTFLLSSWSISAPHTIWKSYQDVVQAGVDPFDHWLNHGVSEGRQISSSVMLRYGKDARNSTERNWRHYRWRDDDVAARLTEPMPHEVRKPDNRSGAPRSGDTGGRRGCHFEIGSAGPRKRSLGRCRFAARCCAQQRIFTDLATSKQRRRSWFPD